MTTERLPPTVPDPEPPALPSVADLQPALAARLPPASDLQPPTSSLEPPASSLHLPAPGFDAAACARLGIDPGEFSQFLNRLHQIAQKPESPEQLRTAFVKLANVQAHLRHVQKPDLARPQAQIADLDLIQRYLTTHPPLAYSRGQFFQLAGPAWQPLPLAQLKARLQSLDRGQTLPAGRLYGILEFLRFTHFVSDDRWDAPSPDSLPCRNGLLHLPTAALQPYQPRDHISTLIPVDYDPAALCPAWDLFLQSTVPDCVEFLQEFVGLALTHEVQFELALVLYGPAGCGKSTFLHALGSLLGPRAAHLSLQSLALGRVDPSLLQGKTFLYSSEQAPGPLPSPERLNAFISGEPFHVQQPYHAPVLVRPTAKLAWACTSLPTVADLYSGLFRRLAVVPFHPLPAEQRDPSLKARLAQEAPGLLNWALAGLGRLHRRGRFELPAIVQTATAQLQASSDFAAQFVSDCCDRDPAYAAPAQALYHAYVSWCHQNGHRPQPSNQLARHWERLGFTRSRSVGRAFWHGLRLSPPPPEDGFDPLHPLQTPDHTDHTHHPPGPSLPASP